ncbi:hypothetical protein LS74_001595 [Helicobacter magdeburgensis]|uniref:Uncharacterized protein n=1 Tax=Helicobacter magdeburgensis TaxID=471858 RepID=A0A4U8T2H9_9HELI|nr:hypothetical protein [Helicobacter magdeburgensis]TLD93448.1 hypothetical protein LS74_001595 [Helicobacter magdeburgensis]
MNLVEKVAKKLATNLAKKEAKKSGKAENLCFALIFGQVSRGINASAHFIQRVQQRFEAQEEEELSGAIARAVRATQPMEQGGNDIAKPQKYYDDMTNIIVVLERAGQFGASLVTTYKRGQENLISDDEFFALQSRGLI